jgi:outer membrane protein assembly factor BamE (lipoprotein component of BamABCDE complex)
MQRRVRISGLLFLAAAIVATILTLWRPIDGYSGLVLLLVYGEDTEWAGGYTNRGFRSTQVGMQRDQIHAILGPPLTTWQFIDGFTTEYWTRSPSGGDHRQRGFVFEGDIAIEKVSGFWTHD